MLINLSCVRRFLTPRGCRFRARFARFPQFAFQDLARRVLRQLRDQMDLARHVMPAEVVAAVLAHLLRGRLLQGLQIIEIHLRVGMMQRRPFGKRLFTHF